MSLLDLTDNPFSESQKRQIRKLLAEHDRKKKAKEIAAKLAELIDQESEVRFCPRCGAQMISRVRDAKWSKYFECEDCLAAFSMYVEIVGRSKRYYMQQGRTLRSQAVAGP